MPSGKIISYDNLRYFNIISHGQAGMIDVTYKSDKITDYDKIKHLKSPVIEGIVPLSDYSRFIRKNVSIIWCKYF